MTGSISAREAGRIRDAARICSFGGIAAIAALFLSFIWGPGIFGFAVWPVGFALLVLACIPVFRRAGDIPVAVVTVIGLAGAAVELAGLFFPPAGSQFRISPVFGAGTIGVGAWLVGAGAFVRDVGGFTPASSSRAMRGGIGLGLVGLSWFVADPSLSLGLLLVGAVLSIGVNQLFREARRFGLPPAAPPRPVAEEAT